MLAAWVAVALPTCRQQQGRVWRRAQRYIRAVLLQSLIPSRCSSIDLDGISISMGPRHNGFRGVGSSSGSPICAPDVGGHLKQPRAALYKRWGSTLGGAHHNARKAVREGCRITLRAGLRAGTGPTTGSILSTGSLQLLAWHGGQSRYSDAHTTAI